MGVSLERVQFKFASIVGELCSEPDVLSQFAVWLDLRLAEYKLKGAISLDCSGEEPDPTWLKGLNKHKQQTALNSQTDRRTLSHSPAVSRSSSLHRSAQQTPISDIPLSHSETVPNVDTAQRLSPDVVLVKEEPDEVFPVALHENAGSVPISGHKRTAVEASVGSHWSKSLSPVQSKIRRMSSKESPSHQSLMTVIGDFNTSDVQESEVMGDNSTIASSSYNMSDSAVKQSDNSNDQSVDFSETSLSNDMLLQEVRWPSHPGASGDTTTNSNVSAGESESLKQEPASSVRLPTRSQSEAMGTHCERLSVRSRIPNIERLPKSSVANMVVAAGILERWISVNGVVPEQFCIEELEPEVLDQFLVTFFKTIKRPDGSEYKRRSMESIRCNIDRFLRETGYEESIISSHLFSASQLAYRERLQKISAPAKLIADKT